MAYLPQRFIHAANVRLDVPVSVHLTEQLTEDLRHALEDATLTSFESVIENCVSRRVDFLLLSGNVFVEADRSLRARIALLNGFQRLNTQKIPVFVLPGDMDPPEAWRAIPELPSNVTVCFSSDPEPVVLERKGRVVTTVSASMWYGQADAFGIRVIERDTDGHEPFRIGVVSRAKYEESRRMVSMTATAGEELLERTLDPDAKDSSHPTSQPASGSTMADPVVIESDDDYEAGFREYIALQMREGCLNYMALGSEPDRVTDELGPGIVHCPGTTQPRNQLEANCGLCTLVTVDAGGNIELSEINSSAVDWKNISLDVDPGATLVSLLQDMKTLLSEESVNPSDRIWAVRWTLTGPLTLLQGFLEEDLELAVAVELDEFQSAGRAIRIVHEVRALPNAWELEDDQHLGQQYAEHVASGKTTDRNRLARFVSQSRMLSEGWQQRMTALVRGVDRERIIAQVRIDGAEWFVPDLHQLLEEQQQRKSEAEGDQQQVTFVSQNTDADPEDDGDQREDAGIPAAVSATTDDVESPVVENGNIAERREVARDRDQSALAERKKDD